MVIFTIIQNQSWRINETNTYRYDIFWFFWDRNNNMSSIIGRFKMNDDQWLIILVVSITSFILGFLVGIN